jgi:hypothetical protein
MSAVAEGNVKKKRRLRIPVGAAGARLVVDELLRRGFDAQLADCYTKKYDVLVGLCGWLATKTGSRENRACGSMVCPQFPI